VVENLCISALDVAICVCTMTDMDPHLGDRVRDRRLELGFGTQADAARAADIGTTTWGLLETGKQVPKSVRVRRRIARVLRWPPDVFDTPEAPLSGPVDAVALIDQLGELRREVRERFDGLEELVEQLLQQHAEGGEP
jgi:DNA-binding XRE family transcriptional regulator